MAKESALTPEEKMAQQIASRLSQAKALRAMQGEDLSWMELGRRVWKRLGRGNVDTSKVSRIKKGQQLMTILECAAFAAELRVPAGWLAFKENGRERDLNYPTALDEPVGAWIKVGDQDKADAKLKKKRA